MLESQKSISDVKNFWNSRPCNIKHSPQSIGSREYFDEVEARKYFVEPHIPKFAEFKRWNNKKVLEIGCGIGTDTINFARNGATITAIDVSDKSLDIARKRAEIFHLNDKIQFYSGNAEELSSFVPKEEYDLIYSFGVIHHSPNPEMILREMKKFSTTRTEIKIMVYYRFSWKVLWILLIYGMGQFWKLDELIAKYSEAQTGCPITYTYSKYQFKQIMERKGYKVLRMDIEHIFPYNIPDYVQYRYKKIWYFRWMPDPLFKWLEHYFGWHLCVNAVIP